MRYSTTNGVEAYKEVTSQQLPRFQLLNILIDCMLEPRKTVAEQISNMATSVSFNIIGLTGACLGAYLHALASVVRAVVSLVGHLMLVLVRYKRGN